ncbi:unnamed protein product [Parascedosporium putredinis]|uniref:C3H1-type domain-containing protein n=1 Tax=Parascedosporium putredinis TaxID=1442378 RepID=A0A9P1GWP8_9PEZI|nr:unnamed protein product [Parascedosporium putredinis]CAI7988989.1 unnamed protein product [Parascedosporium putredinis]
MPAPNMPEFRHARSSSLSIQNSAATPAAPRFDGPHTAHVPCKFFRQGACQAGNACPFSHDLSTAAENICKYFAKVRALPSRLRPSPGNCKFGPKPTTATQSNFHPTTSALTNGLFRADNIPPYTPTYGGLSDERHHHLGRQPSLENGLPTIDTPGYSGSVYGSPRDDDASRFGLALSPANASILDVPLPASFDSNGISNAARYPAGPWPSSVPSKFGLESPSPSLNAAKDARTSEALKLLHTSAFGNDHLSPSIPPSSSPSGGLADEAFGKRSMMHSSRYTKPRVLSSSLPKAATVDRDWEAEFAFLEEDYVPQNLQDLLTPAEKARRGSLRAADAERPEGITKYGSPIGAASPSRWGPFLHRQKEEDLDSRAIKVSAFGHVGSPLRNSSLADEVDARHNGHRFSGPRSGGDAMSALTQQLQKTRMNDDATNPMLHPSSAVGRNANGLASRERDRTVERHVSTGSIGSALGRMTTPIDEEDPAFLFRMEEEEEQQPSQSRRSHSSSIGWSLAGAGKVDSKDHRDSSESVTGR